MNTNTGNSTHPLQRPGLYRHLRDLPALDPAQCALDDRTAEELLAFLQAIAAEVHFFDHEKPLVHKDNAYTSPLVWQPLIETLLSPENEVLAGAGKLPPHLALLRTLVHLYDTPRKALNENIRRHLEYFYRDVLGLDKLPAQPPYAHLVFTLKKNAPPLLLKEGTSFAGPVQENGAHAPFVLQHDLVVSQAQLQQVCGLCADEKNPDMLRFATHAHSADGLGAAIKEQDKGWPAFGAPYWPDAQMGLAVAAPVLKMEQGTRKITLRLSVSGLRAGITQAQLADSFSLSLTGPKGWIQKGFVSPVLKQADQTAAGAQLLEFTCNLNETEPAIVPYNSEVHGGSFEHDLPVVQLLWNMRKTNPGYQVWKEVRILEMTVEAEAENLMPHRIETDAGVANPEKPFFPFGPTAQALSACRIIHSEAFSKKLLTLNLQVDWKNIPASDLQQHYRAYDAKIDNDYFTLNCRLSDATGQVLTTTEKLFNTSNAKNGQTWHFSFAPVLKFVPLPVWNLFPSPIFTLSAGEPVAAKMLALQQIGRTPLLQVKQQAAFDAGKILMNLSALLQPVNVAPGLTLTLRQSFRFTQYRRLLAATIANFSKDDTQKNISLPNEPFSPEIKSIRLSYKATSGNVSFTDAAGIYPNPASPLHLYHIWPFGVRHEEKAKRRHLTFFRPAGQFLLPAMRNKGELYLGLSPVHARQEISLLVLVAKGSANPDKRAEKTTWSVLANNYWKVLGERDILMDTTGGLQTSGIIRLILPAEATMENTWMPTGMAWLRVAVQNNPDAVCRIISISSNAGLVKGTPAFNGRLSAGAITAPEAAIPSLKSTVQPAAGFGGRESETASQWYTRVSERLRHKHRVSSLWDIEHMVMQQFPEISLVKAIPHSDPDGLQRPGHMQLVLVPSLSAVQGENILQPKTDIYTREAVLQWLQQRASAWATYHTVHPVYMQVQVQASVKLAPGYAFAFYREETEKALVGLMAPWTTGKSSQVRFGGSISQTQIVHFLEGLPWISFVTDVKLFWIQQNGTATQLPYISATHPAGVITAHEKQLITEITG